MKTICFYFQVHQPLRLKKYRFINMGKDHLYLDDYANRTIMQKVARRCYLPMNELLLKLIRENGKKFKVAFSISGIAIEQFRMYAPEVLDSFQALARTGCVEFLAETYAHSLASLVSEEEFVDQIRQHCRTIEQEFGVKPKAFRNTELIYSDRIGEIVASLGFRTMLTEGAKHILGWKSPNFVYANAINPKLHLLLRNFKLSDDIAFRFSDRNWSEWPLTADKYVGWLASPDMPGETVNLFMDYETFGEHQWAETGIFDFMAALPAGDQIAEIRHAERSVEKIPARRSAALALPDLVGRRRARRDGMDRQRASERGVRQAVQAPRQDPRDRPSGFHLCLEFPAGFGSFLLHGHQMVFRRRRAQLFQSVRLALRGVHQLYERSERLRDRGRQEIRRSDPGRSGLSAGARANGRGGFGPLRPFGVYDKWPSGRFIYRKIVIFLLLKAKPARPATRQTAVREIRRPPHAFKHMAQGMKKILLLLSASALLWSCDQGKKARIDGTFSGLSHDTVLLEMVTTQQRTVVDSTVTSRQGDFSFRVELPVAAPTFFNLLCNGSVIPLIVSPGEKIAVNSLCDLSHNYTIEGSPDSEILMEFNRFYDRSVATLDSLSRLYAATPADAAHEARRKEILDRYTQDYLRIKREHINFIVSNASSMASIYALYQRLPNDPSLFNPQSDIVYYRIVADSLGRRYPDSPHVAALNKDIERQQTALNMVEEINRKAESPQSYPEIELEDLFGKTQKLTEKNGRVILVDFWSSRDPQSAIRNAELKELYERFGKQTLAIYQVSLDEVKAEWIDAVQKQQLPWTCVFDPRGTAGIAAMSYNVQSVPTNVLIDRSGRIAGKNLYGERLSSKISELAK